MNPLLIIASIALSSCSSGSNMHAVCFSDLDARFTDRVVYAFDLSTAEALKIEYFEGYSANTSYRYAPGGYVREDTWLVDVDGTKDYASRLLEPHYFGTFPKWES